MKSENKQKFSLTGLLVVTGVLLLLIAVLIPQIRWAMLQADLHMVGRQGQAIFLAIEAGGGCEPLGHRSLWPRTQIEERKNRNVAEEQDISEMAFSNSTRYFYVLYDGKSIGDQLCWSPYAPWLDYSQLAGLGVPKMVGTGVLQPENNMWCIAANLTDDTDDMIPVLVTRNIDCSSFHIKTQANPDTPLRWSQQYVTPFGNRGFVMLRRSGAIFHGTAKYATTGAIYPVGDGLQSVAGNTNLASLVYLTPDGIAYPQ